MAAKDKVCVFLVYVPILSQMSFHGWIEGPPDAEPLLVSVFLVLRPVSLLGILPHGRHSPSTQRTVSMPQFEFRPQRVPTIASPTRLSHTFFQCNVECWARKLQMIPQRRNSWMPVGQRERCNKTTQLHATKHRLHEPNFIPCLWRYRRSKLRIRSWQLAEPCLAT